MKKFVITLGLAAVLLHSGLAGAAVPQTGGTGGGVASAADAGTGAQSRSMTVATTYDMPNGVKVVVPVDPPSGQEYSGASALVVPAGTTWKLVGFTFNVTFDTTKTGTSNISMVIRDPDGNAHLRIPMANGLDRAARYVDFSGWVGAPQSPAQTIDHECILASIPDLVLPAGWQITTLTEGRRTTDKVKEMQLWVEESPA